MGIINSILDTDLYKLTMGQAVFRSYDRVDVEYKFINRGMTSFPKGFIDRLKEEVEHMSALQLTDAEYNFLKDNCPYLRRSYLDFLRGYRFDPNEVHINEHHINEDDLSIFIVGPWYRCILWEVPLMAIISELYFKMTNQKPDEDYLRRALAKGKLLEDAGCNFADFGTRRRFSYDVHARVVARLRTSNTFVGTSNVHFAMTHGLKPIGTHAHEWFSAIAAMYGYPKANANALKAWQREYDGDLGIALTDTFTTDVFFKQFTRDFAKLYDGVRHDSSCPFEFTDKVVGHYKSLGINPMHKTIVFSDGLDTDKCLDIANYCHGKINCSFGIGTNFTNDVGVKPLNMVIKLVMADGQHAVKLSDVAGKETGYSKTIDAVKELLGVY